MQDRFKVRAWDNEKKEFRKTYPSYIYSQCITNPRRYIVEQCTGLKDKNGKLIYEGDIVKHIRFDKPFSCKRKIKEVLCVIKWNKELMSFCIVTINTKDAFLSYESHYKEPHFDLYVVGNIHENPDLLENE